MILKALKYHKWIWIVGYEQIGDSDSFESTVKVLY
jgi:hypothetical protein